MTRKRYTMIGLGGTFDHFHEGHKHFLRYAADLAETVLVGVTKARLSHHKPFASAIEDFSERQGAVKHFCHQEKIQVKVVPLTDPYGPTLEKSPVRALCVTPETSAGADKINEVRDKLGMRPLPAYICDYILAENGDPIHSAFIRAGIMNRQGQLYASLLNQDLVLNQIQREFFSQPQGPLIETVFENPLLTVVVGDRCLETFIQKGWSYDLGIYDLRTQRQAYPSAILEKLKPEITIENPASQVSLKLRQALDTSLAHHHRHLKIEGEEDLATIALVLLLPLGTSIYYGQKDQGMIHLEVSETLKESFRNQLCST